MSESEGYEMMVSANLTRDQRRRMLLHRACEWANQVESINARACLGSGDSDFEPWDVHDLALALAHLAKCLTRIDELGATPQIHAAAEQFKHAWQDTPLFAHNSHGQRVELGGGLSLRELRNVFEHEDEYIVGKGQKPLVSNEWHGGGPGLIAGADGIEVFWIFGVSYRVKLAIAAALECKSALELVVGTPSNPLPLA
jgi:hypothetical protein